MLREVSTSLPNVIFLDAALDGSDAIEALRKLAALEYRGSIQLMSGRAADILEHLYRSGEEQGLRMRPPLKKPFRISEVRRVLEAEGLVGETATLQPQTTFARPRNHEILCNRLYSSQTQALAQVDVLLLPSLSNDQGWRDASPQSIAAAILGKRVEFSEVADQVRERSAEACLVVRLPIGVAMQLDLSALSDVWRSDSKRHLLVIELSQDALQNWRQSRDLMLRLRIHGAGVRFHIKGDRFTSLAGRTRVLELLEAGSLPIHELSFEFQGHSGELAHLSRLLSVAQSQEVRTIGGAIPPAELAHLRRSGLDLYVPLGSSPVAPRDLSAPIS